MEFQVLRRLPASAKAVLSLIGLLAAINPAAAQTPPADFDGTNATFFISANSMLRYGDSLISKHYMTVGSEGMQIKGRGRCTVFVCPVSFNGIDLFARRSRLRTDAGTAGTAGGTYGGPVRPGTGVPGPATGYGNTGKQCAGITRTLRRGDDSNDVRILQEILIKAGYNEVTADGRYGRKTEAAVTQFQRKTNINADGTVGPKTLSFLPC
jgi:hypothetical protein